MEHSPEVTGPPPRRGPSVDLDPGGIVMGKSRTGNSASS